MGDNGAAADDVLFPDAGPGSGLGPEQARERVAFFVRRIEEKIRAYENYEFTRHESRALNVFFDLAQEFTDKYDLWALAVVIPRVFFGKDARLYLLNADKRLEWRCCSRRGCVAAPADAGAPPPLVDAPLRHGDRHYFPIKGNHELLSQLPFEPEKDVIGVLEIFPATDISAHERLFFEKYANRIGYRVHNRLIAIKNQEHLQFIRALVQDIGHNVIVPNMYFKLFYRRLESRIMVLRDIAARFMDFTDGCSLDGEGRSSECRRIKEDMDGAFTSLMEQYREILSHYEQTSLFLETLLRRSHFEQGRYVLEPRPCNLRTQIVEPQIERYRTRLADRGVAVDLGPGVSAMPDPMVLADVGLVSQVVANLLSNAVKYARDAEDGGGKRLTVDWRPLPANATRPEEAVKLTVFTTGPHIAEEDASRLYSEGFRGGNATSEYGTGHGLYFIKEVIGLHRGAVGYERAPSGNVFFVVLPTQAAD